MRRLMLILLAVLALGACTSVQTLGAGYLGPWADASG